MLTARSSNARRTSPCSLARCLDQAPPELWCGRASAELALCHSVAQSDSVAEGCDWARPSSSSLS